MTIQTVEFNISRNDEAAMSIVTDLMYNSFSVTVECAGESWHIIGSRYLPDDDADDAIRDGHDLH